MRVETRASATLPSTRAKKSTTEVSAESGSTPPERPARRGGAATVGFGAGGTVSGVGVMDASVSLVPAVADRLDVQVEEEPDERREVRDVAEVDDAALDRLEVRRDRRLHRPRAPLHLLGEPAEVHEDEARDDGDEERDDLVPREAREPLAERQERAAHQQHAE